MNILAIGCHPDDVEICCAGTLAKCVKRGDKVTVAHLCTGSLGHVVIPPEELVPIRAAEAREAGKLAGIEVLDGVFGDLDIYADNAESRNKVVEIIQYAQPDVILTHNPDDYMPDHVATSKLVFDAAFTATLPNWPSKTGKAAKLVPIYSMDTLAGDNVVPDEFGDVTDEIDLKIQLLECHRSQLDWMREHDGIDFADMVRTCSKYRGYQCGAAYAEGFKMCKAYLKGATRRLLP